MSQRLRVEDPERVSFLTTRTRRSEIWFTNNNAFESKALGSLAKYQHVRCAHLYSFVMQGNHPHMIARFPLANRADFMRDTNSSFQLHLKNSKCGFEGASLWARRYSEEILPLP